MPACKIIALTKAFPGREHEFNEWYENVHIPEVLSFPGMKQAQRYEKVKTLMGEESNECLAIFHIDIDDEEVLLAAMERAAIEGTATPTDSVDMETVRVSLFRGCGGPFYPGV